MQPYLDKLDVIVSNLFAKYSRLAADPGVLLSGGIDSSTIAYLVSCAYPTYHIFSMGTKETKDREFVSIMADFLKHPYHWVDLTEEEMKMHTATVVELLKKASVPQSVMQVSLALGYYLIFKTAQAQGVTHIFTGQGPDITFAGYHKYKSVPDVNSEIQKDLPLLEIDKRRDGAMASYFGITLLNPYLEQEMVDFALRVPAEFKIKNGIEKYILRKYAESKGLPKAIAERPKKAFQYSTGLQKVVTKYYHSTL